MPHNTAPPAFTTLPIWQRILLWAAILGLLAAVFALYMQADFMVAMADYVWSCF